MEDFRGRDLHPSAHKGSRRTAFHPFPLRALHTKSGATTPRGDSFHRSILTLRFGIGPSPRFSYERDDLLHNHPASLAKILAIRKNGRQRREEKENSPAPLPWNGPAARSQSPACGPGNRDFCRKVSRRPDASPDALAHFSFESLAMLGPIDEKRSRRKVRTGNLMLALIDKINGGGPVGVANSFGGRTSAKKEKTPSKKMYEALPHCKIGGA